MGVIYLDFIRCQPNSDKCDNRRLLDLIIQNMFGDTRNENIISVKIKAIYSAVTNVIPIKRNVNLLTIHIRVDIQGKRRRGYFCRSKFIDRIFHADKHSALKLAFDRSNDVRPA